MSSVKVPTLAEEAKTRLIADQGFTKPEVVKFPHMSYSDIPGRLRALAEQIEGLDPNERLSCVVILGRNTQKVEIFGYGERTSGLEMQGWLARAVHSIAKQCDE